MSGVLFNSDRAVLAIEYDKQMETRKWLQNMPNFKLGPDWEISILPPFMGATIRFGLRNLLTGKKVSVYLDCYGHLAPIEEPYWEIYPSSDGDAARFMFGETEAMMAEIKKVLDSPKEAFKE